MQIIYNIVSGDGKMKKTGKIIISIVAVLLIAICVVLKVYWSDILSILPKSPVMTDNTEVTLIAHRGFSSVAPANTLASIKEAGEADFYGAEFDIRLTADAKWAVIHNDSVKSMTDGEGNISEMTLEEIKKLNIDNGYGLDTYPDEKIPTLEEALEQCKASDIIPVIEIKLNADQQPDYKELADIIKSAECEKVMIIAFSKDAIVSLKAELPEAEYWLLLSEISDEDIAYCAENGIDGIDFNANKSENLEYVDKILDAGLTAGAWTVDSVRMMEKLCDMGVKYITTNTIYKG